MAEFYTNGKSHPSLELALEAGRDALAKNQGWTELKIYEVIGKLVKSPPPVLWQPSDNR